MRRVWDRLLGALSLRRSLRNQLALVFFAITLLAVAVPYLYVAPGLQSHLINSRLADLRVTARAHAGPIRDTVGASDPLSVVRRRVNQTSQTTGNRVTLLSVDEVEGQPELAMQMDSSGAHGQAPVRWTVAQQAASTGKIASGTVHSSRGTLAQAAEPVTLDHRVVAVIVFTTPIADVLRTVTTVRHEILVAGGLALLIALIAGWLMARALALRVRRVERAAKQLASGRFTEPIPVSSADELGQLAVAFNDMQQQLRELELARKKFIATASHELRTPIFSLGGFVELLEDDELDPETRRRFLEQVRNQVTRLGKLSVDLLDLSRLEAGSLELRPEEVDLGELTRSVSGEFEPTLAQHDAHLELRLAGDPGGRGRLEANCDPVRVAQIVRILIDNALTHTPAGTRITVSAARLDGHVQVAVRDDGEGIDARAVARIFEPFYTADNAQGSGLGLAIASELADRMDGQLSVASATGETTFTLELPA